MLKKGQKVRLPNRAFHVYTAPLTKMQRELLELLRVGQRMEGSVLG